MKMSTNFIVISNAGTKKHMFIVEESAGYYLLAIVPSLEVEKVRKRSIGKRIREFMREENDS